MSRTIKTTTTTTTNSNNNHSANLMQSVVTTAATQHLKRYEGQFSRVEGWLENRPLANEYVGLVAAKTGARKAYVLVGGAVLLLMFVVFGPIAKLFGSLIGVSYPAYKSIKAIESPQQEDDRQWLTYWVVFAFFTVARNFSGFILSWFPFYNVVELGVLLWMMAPIRRNGSYFLYQTVLRPFVLKHIDTIDSTIDSVKTSLGVPNTEEASPTTITANGSTAPAEVAPKLVQIPEETINESLLKLEQQQPELIETTTTIVESKEVIVDGSEQKSEENKQGEN